MTDENNKNANIFPSFGIAIDGSYFYKNARDKKWQVARTIEITIFNYEKYSGYFKFKEVSNFGARGEEWYRASRIAYQPLDFFRFSIDSGFGLFSFVLDHECYNMIDVNDVDNYMYRWYGAAFTFESYAMRTGQYNINIKNAPGEKFEFINNFEYWIYFGKALETVEFKYDYFFKGRLRYDIFTLYSFIPYLECSFRGIIDDRIRFDRSVEAGTRINFDNFYAVFYYYYSYEHDIDVYNGARGEYDSFGLKLETFIGSEITGKKEDINNRKNILFKNILHFKGHYSRIFGSKYYGYNGDNSFYLTILNFSKIKLNIGNRVNHYSKTGPGNLYPRYIQYTFIADMLFSLHENYFLKLSYEYNRLGEGNSYKGYNEVYSTMGFELLTKGFVLGNRKTIYINDSILKNFDWSFEFRRIVNKKNYNEIWDAVLLVNYNYGTIGNYVAYVEPSVAAKYSEKINFEYGCEFGLRKMYSIIVNPFCKFDYKNNSNEYEESKELTFLAGIGFEI